MSFTSSVSWSSPVIPSRSHRILPACVSGQAAFIRVSRRQPRARGAHCGSAGLSGRRVANGSLATSVSCRVDGATALSARRA